MSKGICEKGHETDITSERPWACSHPGCEERPVFGNFLGDESIRERLRAVRLDALDDAAALVLKAAHNAAHEGIARALREVESKIRQIG